MKRRSFLTATAALALLLPVPAQAVNKPAAKKPVAKSPPRKPAAKPPASSDARARAQDTRNVISLPDEPLAQWRTYEIRSGIRLSGISGKVRLWIPLAQYKDTLWERSLGHHWEGNFQAAGIYRDPVAEMEVFYADWGDGSIEPQLQIISQVATQDRHFDITKRGAVAERTEVLRRCLQETEHVPVDGPVRQLAERAIGRIKDPVAQGKAIYDWVVEHVRYAPEADPLGSGRIALLLENGNLSGGSADIALLFVALCRSIGIPARPVFGLRIDSSRLFSGLGSTGNLVNSQQCRAEFYTPGYGWIPVNPADVRKAVRDEDLGSGDSRLAVLKKLLFGFWEMNWISYNAAQDVTLRGAAGPSLPFLSHPVIEVADTRLDLRDGSRVAYEISASRVDG